jgi:hypothetical protein
MTSYLKTPAAISDQESALRAARQAISQLGLALPCRVTKVMGPIVTVAFLVQESLPDVTVPVAGSEYIRLPLKVGCSGVCFPATVSIGGITGLGAGAPSLSAQAGNLSALAFFPMGSKSFSATDDQNKVVIYGPDGAIVRTMSGLSKVDWSDTRITITAPLIVFDGPVQFNHVVDGVSGTIDFGSTNLITTGTATAGTDVVGGGKSLATHVHIGVTTGGGDSGPPL